MGYNINEDGTVTRFDVESNQQESPKEEPGCFGLICSFLFPIIGVIIYFNQKDKVDNASYYLWAAGISFVIGLILSAAGS
mgnify:CR=1 FL=1